MDNGILIIDKPYGFTSHDVIGKLRGMYKMKQIGHAGTLDPIATGVLVVLLGNATKASDYLMSEEKEYIAGFKLGVITDTQDITGNVIKTCKANVSQYMLKECLKKFLGSQEQLPPMYSAIQKDGKRLYDLARKGIEVERNKRDITISSIEMLENTQEDEYSIRVCCSKGTYIRTLCNDIGERLGCGAVMTSLKRVRSGCFTAMCSYTLEHIQSNIEDKSRFLLPTEYAFKDYQKITLNDLGETRAKNGAFLDLSHIQSGSLPKEDQLVTVYSSSGVFLQLGVGGVLDKGGNCIFCKKSFVI